MFHVVIRWLRPRPLRPLRPVISCAPQTKVQLLECGFFSAILLFKFSCIMIYLYYFTFFVIFEIDSVQSFADNSSRPARALVLAEKYLEQLCTLLQKSDAQECLQYISRHRTPSSAVDFKKEMAEPLAGPCHLCCCRGAGHSARERLQDKPVFLAISRAS